MKIIQLLSTVIQKVKIDEVDWGRRIYLNRSLLKINRL